MATRIVDETTVNAAATKILDAGPVARDVTLFATDNVGGETLKIGFASGMSPQFVHWFDIPVPFVLPQGVDLYGTSTPTGGTVVSGIATDRFGK